ncbi:MAG: YkgJ family cysteine cluster protein [Candidatus Magnetoovum sp. WYHC-5]|nr:YkgJ family cysteine cluster protein [Candidatus Magnetoovum sp. WYHC-5]
MESVFSKLANSPVETVQLKRNDTFHFNCHKGVSCFTKCCGDLDIFLTPYDIVRMKNHLGINSSELLLKYTQTVILTKSQVPMIKMNMNEDGRCVFVRPMEGCLIYNDRPVACRYYPVGMGALKSHSGGDFYFLLKEEHCQGFKEPNEWVIANWRMEQGIDVYDDVNKDWIDIIINKKTVGVGVNPDEKSIKMFYMASYDLDTFKSFVFESRFFDVFDIEEEYIFMIKESELELQKFALRWLKYVLFKEPTMFLKKEYERK